MPSINNIAYFYYLYQYYNVIYIICYYINIGTKIFYTNPKIAAKCKSSYKLPHKY